MSILLTLHVQPRAKRNVVEGFDSAGRLKVRVTSPPADGAANDAVAEVLASTLGVAKRQIMIQHGHTSRTKRVRVDGINADEATAVLGNP